MRAFSQSLHFFLWVWVLSADQRPNILFCISDDQSYAHTGANGDPVVKTPAFDLVAKEGFVLLMPFVTLQPAVLPEVRF